VLTSRQEEEENDVNHVRKTNAHLVSSVSYRLCNASSVRNFSASKADGRERDIALAFCHVDVG